MSDNSNILTVEARWRHLRDNGRNQPVDVSSNELINSKPSWLDETRWLLARESMKKFEIGLSFSSLAGLLLILQLPEGLEPLLVTGNSKDIPSLFKRYLATGLHTKSWHEDDIFDPNTKGFKSVRIVRGMHKRVQTIMNERFKVPDAYGNPRIWYNHYDVAMTQFAFIGMAMMYPKRTGLIAATKVELESINYFWRVLGYMMGIKDEFNACQCDDYQDIVEFNKLLFKHEYLDVFAAQPCKTGLEMTKGICLAMENFMPSVTFNSVANWWKNYFKFNGYEPQPMTIREKFLNALNRISFSYLMKNEKILELLTKNHRKKFDHRLKSKDKFYELLKKKYGNSTEQTYYSDRVDYFDKTKREENSDLGPKSSENPSSVAISNGDKLVTGGCPFGFDAVLPPTTDVRAIAT